MRDSTNQRDLCVDQRTGDSMNMTVMMCLDKRVEDNMAQ